MTSPGAATWPHLFAPLQVGPMTLPHRAIMSAHGMGLGAGGPGVSERYHAYLVARARGGAAMIGMESAPVHPSTCSRSLVIRLYEDGCIPTISRGMTPNQGGTWWFGRGGWCPGAPVEPWIIDVTAELTPGTTATFTYAGTLACRTTPDG